MSDKAGACPHCGAPVEAKARRSGGESGDVSAPPAKKNPTWIVVIVGGFLALLAVSALFAGGTMLFDSREALAPDPHNMSLEELRRTVYARCGYGEAPDVSTGFRCPDETRAWFLCVLEHHDCVGGGPCQDLEDVALECVRCRVADEDGGGKNWKRCDPYRKYDRPTSPP